MAIALSSAGITHGRIQSGYLMTSNIVQVRMAQTVANRLDAIQEPDLLVIDDANHFVCTTYSGIVKKWRNAKIRGVTATPERLDGVGLGEAFEEMVLGPDVRELIDDGHFASYRYLAPNMPIDLSRVRCVGGDFNAGDLAAVVDQNGITGDVVEHYIRHLPGRTAIAFCITIAHAKHVAGRFRDNGIPAASIDGTMSSHPRHNLVNRLRVGDIFVLTSCDIVSKGFDAILARPTQSFAFFRQQVGRCLRPRATVEAAVIMDHAGNVFRRRLPDAPHEWLLNSRKRTQAEHKPGGRPFSEMPSLWPSFFNGRRSGHAPGA